MTRLKETPNNNKINLPLVSICTPTFNRRPFIPFVAKCIEQQNYPKDKMEWIIIDDGTDNIEDVIQNIQKNNMPKINYYYYEEKMLLGKKRNLMHSKCSGDIIIYMDDDDYYPPERISHAVNVLMNNPHYLIAGSSEMHIYFDHNKTMYKFGPYKENHSTAATFAFRKELLLQTQFDDTSVITEEKSFLKNYTIPLIQLDSHKTILVFSHNHNSLDKRKLIETPHSKYEISKYSVDDFIKDKDLKEFYTKNMNILLTNYDPGHPRHKPLILEKIKDMEEEREKKIKEYNKLMEIYKNKKEEENKKDSKNIEVVKSYYEKIISEKTCIINELLKKMKELMAENNELKNIINNS